MRVNGKKTRETTIVDGDVITIAGNRIVFRQLAAETPAAPPKKASSIGPKRA